MNNKTVGKDDYKTYRSFNTLFNGLPKNVENRSPLASPRSQRRVLPPLPEKSPRDLFSPMKAATPLLFLDVDYKSLYMDSSNQVYKNRYSQPKNTPASLSAVVEMMSRSCSPDPHGAPPPVHEVNKLKQEEEDLQHRIESHRSAGVDV